MTEKIDGCMSEIVKDGESKRRDCIGCDNYPPRSNECIAWRVGRIATMFRE